MEYRKHLNELKSKLANKQVSLLVGSGFSKNVSDKFPSWEELLFDLIYKMHKEVFNAEYFLKAKSSFRKVDKAAFIKLKCKQVIAERGYLDIVSDYVRQSSHEDITTYIEERTPYIEYEKEQIVIETRGQREILKPESLNLHRMILELPWNNIYTTNYDQLLDVCVDEFQYQTFTKEIETLESEISNLNDHLEDSVEQMKKLDQSTPIISDTISNDFTDSMQSHTIDPQKLHEDKEASRKIQNDLYESIRAKTEQIESKEQAQSSCFNIVRDASGLQLKRNSNIIKLHGSLRSKDQRKDFMFGFDGDHKKQYIISKEHYQAYPQEHEPFTQLMRISLLQESFCLVGFSGDDPNFLAWVDWVRDILQRNGRKNGKNGSYKIYLIDVNEENIDTAKQLFFENYNILRIPLMDPEVLNLIRGTKAIPHGPSKIKNCVQLFLNFLGDHDKINLIVPVSDLSIINQWQAIWNKLNFYQLDIWQSNELIKSNLQLLKLVRDKILIPNLKDSYFQNQEKVLNLLAPGNKRHWKKEFDSENLQLILFAVKDSFLPLNYAIDRVYIDKLLADPSTTDEASQMLRLSESMINRLPLDTASDFQKTLSLAFSFKFEELTLHLNSWRPCPNEIMKKAGFLSFINPSEAESFLEVELGNYEQFTPEQRLYIYELLSFIKVTRSWARERKLDKMISGLKSSGFTSIEDNLRTIYKAMEENPRKPYPLGSERYSVAHPQEVEENPNARYALKFLMLLVETGFQLNIRRAYRLSAAEWYKIISNGFEFYPSAFLFYGLQLEDADYLKRLGQDYASSSKVPDFILNTIATNLLNAVPTAHKGYRKSIYIFLSTMLISVDPEIWEEEFMRLWRCGIADSTVFEEKHKNDINPLVACALRYLKKEEHLLEILKNCLASVLVSNNDIVVDYLYYLNRNIHFKEIIPRKHDESTVDDAIYSVINALKEELLGNVMLLGNIYSLLNDDQKQKIIDKLAVFDLEKINNTQLWSVMVYFLKDETEILNRLKSSLLNSPILWHSGIDGNTISMGTRPLELSRITANSNNFGGLIWNDEEVIVLYEKLVAGLPDLQKYAFKDDPWSSFDELIAEMFWFMNFYKDKLSALDTYLDTNAIVQKLYNSNVTYNSVQEGLISNIKSEVIYALSELSGLFYKGDIRKTLNIIVVNRVLLQSGLATEAALSYLSAWLSHKNGQSAFGDMSDLLLSILRKYKIQILEEGERSFVEEHLVKMAFALYNWGHKDDIVEYWIAFAKASRFNNIKQFLAKLEYQKAKHQTYSNL